MRIIIYFYSRFIVLLNSISFIISNLQIFYHCSLLCLCMYVNGLWKVWAVIIGCRQWFKALNFGKKLWNVWLAILVGGWCTHVEITRIINILTEILNTKHDEFIMKNKIELELIHIIESCMSISVFGFNAILMFLSLCTLPKKINIFIFLLSE